MLHDSSIRRPRKRIVALRPDSPDCAVTGQRGNGPDGITLGELPACADRKPTAEPVFR